MMHQVDLADLADLCTPWSIRVVVTLRIADHIASGIADIVDLARVAGCDPYYLARVLRHLIDKGIFLEPAPGRFALNDVAQRLSDPSLRLGLDLAGIGGRMALVWGSLLSAVRAGRPAYQEVFDRPFWEDLDANPEISASFDALMGTSGHGIPDPRVLIDDDWRSVRTIVDVGGGTGALLAEILRAQPAILGTLVDLPRTVARSHEVFRAAGVAGRVTTVGQSFFDPLPAGADCYLLKNVLTDWPDDAALAILKRCAEAMRPDGRLVVLGGVSPDDARGGSGDLLMMVLVGGQERSLTEFRVLADQAGLKVLGAARQSSGRFVVECGRSG